MQNSVEHLMRRVASGLTFAAMTCAVAPTIAATAAVAAAGGAATPVAESATPVSASPDVNISNFSFQPALMVVKAGTKVTWTNHDTTPHTITSTDKRFVSSSGLDTNDQYSYVFDKPGSYEYFCSLHPMMVGKVVVQSEN